MCVQVLLPPPQPGHREVRRERPRAEAALRELPQPEEAQREELHPGDGQGRGERLQVLPGPPAPQHPGMGQYSAKIRKKNVDFIKFC